jgi:hypothetical protein
MLVTLMTVTGIRAGIGWRRCFAFCLDRTLGLIGLVGPVVWIGLIGIGLRVALGCDQTFPRRQSLLVVEISAIGFCCRRFG